jgi:hypothetical protein
VVRRIGIAGNGYRFSHASQFTSDRPASNTQSVGGRQKPSIGSTRTDIPSSALGSAPRYVAANMIDVTPYINLWVLAAWTCPGLGRGEFFQPGRNHSTLSFVFSSTIMIPEPCPAASDLTTGTVGPLTGILKPVANVHLASKVWRKNDATLINNFHDRKRPHDRET